MANYLQREKAPLTAGEWDLVDATVREVQERYAIGRRFLPLHTPTAPGMEVAREPAEDGLGRGRLHRTGRSAQRQDLSRGLELPIIYSDCDCPQPGPGFLPALRDGVARAAQICALAEDHLILNGPPGLPQPGLLTAPGRLILPLSEWSEPDRAGLEVTEGLSRLAAGGHRGPCALVLGSELAGCIIESPAARELAQLCGAGLFVSPLMPRGKALLVNPDPQAMDLAVAQDLTTAFQPGPEGGRLRVFALLTLRIKDPGAICTLEA